MLSSRAEFIKTKENWDKVEILKRPVKGDATETGLIKCYELLHAKSDLGTHELRSKNPQMANIPFNSSTKFTASVVDLNGTGRYSVMMKGAPEVVIDHCESIYLNGSYVALDKHQKQNFLNVVAEFGGNGERVLGFGHLELDPYEFPKGFEFKYEDEPNFPIKGLMFVGLMSLIDPPKATVPAAVEKCQSAGVRVIMVTGDHAITATAIAKQVGIVKTDKVVTYVSSQALETDEKSAAVVTGKVLSDMTDIDLDSVLSNHEDIVFARTTPAQKLRIVEGCQRMGAIVAVTGDGVNDSPALKKADIGVAMGISGSDVSKEAADMILLDDNFATIVAGVEEGRLIFDHLVLIPFMTLDCREANYIGCLS